VIEPDGSSDPEPWEAFRGPNGGERESKSIVTPAAEIEREMARLSVKVKARTQERNRDRRVPSYILLSSETRLMQQFGPAGFKQVDAALSNLCDAVRRRKGWTAHRVYIDDPGSLRPFGLTPADPGNAWQIKLRLADLDVRCAARAR
jgi:hypothetical protein